MVLNTIRKSIRGVFMAAAIAASVPSFINQWQIAHYQIQQDDQHPIIVPTLGTLISPYFTYLSWERAEKPLNYNLGPSTLMTGIARNTPRSIREEMKWATSALGYPGAAVGNVMGSITGYIARDEPWRPQNHQRRFQ